MRWPGSFGSAFLYYVVPRVILFREEHSPRALVKRVQFVSAPGVTEGVARSGGPQALITSKALFAFEGVRKRFALKSVHGGATGDEIRSLTGFDYDAPEKPPPTPSTDSETLALLRGHVTDELAETYPQFAAALAAERAG